jgi:hypothetical protein
MSLAFPNTAADIAEVEKKMQLYHQAAHHRMSSALAWLDTQPQVTDVRQHRHTLVYTQRQLAAGVPHLEHAARQAAALRQVLQHAENHPDPGALKHHATLLTTRIQAAADQALAQLHGYQHPYEENHLILDSLKLPPSDACPFSRSLDTVSLCEGVLMPLLERVLGDLSAITLEAEKSLTALSTAARTPPQATWETPALSVMRV